MPADRPPQPLYLVGGRQPAFATLHPAAGDTGVLLCLPFGWEEVAAYRSLRAWAEDLADHAHPTLRLSLPGTGDSAGGPRDPQRLSIWTDTVQEAARWLLAELGVRRVSAIGLGLSGLACLRAAGAGAPIEQLILWGVPRSGRAALRELRAFARLERERFFEGLPEPPPPPEGELEAGGFLLSAETVHDLEALDPIAPEWSYAGVRRALLLGRDGRPPDAALRDRLAQAGVEVTEGEGRGWGELTSHPQQSRPPVAAMARVSEWLAVSAAPMRDGTAARTPAACSSAEIQLPGSPAVRETPIAIPRPFGAMAAIVSEPLERPGHDLCLVLLNVGAVRRTGPNRMWVELARRWAARGLPCVRLDIEGIGDADGEVAPYGEDSALYVYELVDQALAALDHLQASGIGQRFVVGGLCSGAFWAFHALLRDPRVCAALMVNARLLIWESGAGPARDLRALLRRPFSLRRVLRVARGERLRAAIAWILTAPVRSLRSRITHRESEAVAAGRDVEHALEGLRASGRRALLVFSAGEPLYEELERSGRLARLQSWPNVTVERIPVRDHTLRPLSAQRQAHAVLDAAIEAELREALREDGFPTVPA